jgi:chitin disaccharide deacetylase
LSHFSHRSYGFELRPRLEAASNHCDGQIAGGRQYVNGETGGCAGTDLSEVVRFELSKRRGSFGIVEEKSEMGTVLGVRRINFRAKVSAICARHGVQDGAGGQNQAPARLIERSPACIFGEGGTESLNRLSHRQEADDICFREEDHGSRVTRGKAWRRIDWFVVKTILLMSLALPLTADVQLILHADDAGMSHSTNLAVIELLEKNAVSSASIMMPCPWAPEFAEYARAHPEKDLGLHLTLTSEWKHYRWGPVAPRDRVANLVDPDGFLWRTVEDVAKRAAPAEIEIELRAQIARAKQMGIQFTHFDTHMGTLYARPDYFQVFEKLGREFNVPILRVKPSTEAERAAPRPTIDYLLRSEERYKKEGLFRLDSLLTNPARGTNTYDERKAAYYKCLRELKAGTHMLIIHPAVLGDELKAITNSAAARDGDYRIFLDPGTQALLKELKIRLTGWRDVK